jgi:hypothetical protein
MPRVLTVTQNPEESPEQFAERISGQLDSFFNESTEPAPESTDETSTGPAAEPTDVSAAPEEEPAPPG